ncbi:hypothetical protein [Micromonospora sp. CPCC 206061]|uniref:hypothetical protein n=1 Tax=Micromonospora sp. CPCC 206061 TaxID=3122410 RepID=UPI002FF40534
MSDTYSEESTLPAQLNVLGSRLAEALNTSPPATKSIAALNTPLPPSTEEKIDLLESHLRTSLAETTDMGVDPIDFSATSESFAEILRFARDARAFVAVETNSDVFTLSPCETAVGAGILLISVGCGIHPIAGFIGFAIGVELLLENCG